MREHAVECACTLCQSAALHAGTRPVGCTYSPIMAPTTLPIIAMISDASTDHQNPVTTTPTSNTVNASHEASCMNNQLMIKATKPKERMEKGRAMRCTMGLMEALISAINKENAAMPSTAGSPMVCMPGSSAAVAATAMVITNQRERKLVMFRLCQHGAIIEIMKLHIYLVRHGQTLFNKYNRLQGWTNAPLTEDGLRDAERAGHKLADIDFAAAYCSDTTRAQLTAQAILDINAEHGHTRPELVSDMHFREQCYGYFEGQDMAQAWWAAGAPHGAPTYNAIVRQFGLGATRDFLKEADPFHDAESDAQYWRRVEDGFAMIGANKVLQDGDKVLQISHGNTLLSLMHRFTHGEYDLNERPANGSVTCVQFDTELPFDQALHVVSYNQ